jgi:hypothetical protein
MPLRVDGDALNAISPQHLPKGDKVPTFSADMV